MRDPFQDSSDQDSSGPVTDCRPEDKYQLVDRIAASRHLRKAPRLTELLRFLTERSIEGTAGNLREQTIGAAIFGRETDYDTSQDNIVRVQVSQLRKKLDSYFSSEGSGEPLIVEIPRGSYIPVFSHRPIPESQAKKSSVADTILPLRSSACPRLLIFTLICIILILTVISGRLWLRQPVAAPAASSNITSVALDSLWRNLIRTDSQTDVVLGDSTLTILQDYSGGYLTLDGLLQRRYGDVFPASLPAEKREQLLSLVERRYTSLTDVEMIVRIMRIYQTVGFTPAIHLARDYQIKALKTNNVIILGSKRSNPWVELFEPRMNFRFAYNEGDRQPTIQNLQPHAGEQDFYAPVRNGIGYSIISFMPNLTRTGAVLLLEGENSISTKAAGEFVTSEEQLARFFNMIGYVPGQSTLPWFEVLIQIEKLQEAPKSFRIVAFRLIQM